MEDNLGLTGKQLMVYEAVKKIHTGEVMRREGLIELANLIPDGVKTVANRMLRSSAKEGLFRNKTRTDAELIDRILKMIDKGEPVTAKYVTSKLNISKTHAGRLRSKIGKAIVDKVSEEGGQKQWVRINKTITTSDPPTDSQIQIVSKFLKEQEWVTMHKIVKVIKMDWYQVKNTLEHLKENKQAKIVEKAGNPAHKGTSSFRRNFHYWESM